MINLRGKKVTIIGLGISGKAAAELCIRLGAKVKISECAYENKISCDIKSWESIDNVVVEYGGHTQSFIEDSDYVILSPGVRIDSQAVLWAKKKDIVVINEIELAWHFCPKPIIAVTGSNGKTTVAMLISNIFQKAGKKTCLCGNIGSPFSHHVSLLRDIDYVVLEVSSFQLESIVDFRAHIAVVLNITQNHLDRHKDIKDYHNAKKRIFMNQTQHDYAVLNYEQSKIDEFISGIKSQVSYFNDPQEIKDSTIKNENYLASIEVARIAGIDKDTCVSVFDEFKGVEHRLEWVRSINGIDFINDSKSTTAEAGRWALERIDNPIVMICGGRDKNIDFSVLKNFVKDRVKSMIVIGEASEKLKNTFCDITDIVKCDDLKSAVLESQKQAVLGDCVLLSPMCASFDMFSNFEERGKVFKQIVNNI